MKDTTKYALAAGGAALVGAVIWVFTRPKSTGGIPDNQAQLPMQPFADPYAADRAAASASASGPGYMRGGVLL